MNLAPTQRTKRRPTPRHPLGPLCSTCPLRRSPAGPVPAVGPLTTRMMMIGEAPGRDEDRKGEPFVGESGRELGVYLVRSGIDRYAFYLTNRIKCRPPDNATPDATMLDCCERLLQEELDLVRPWLIVALGAVATHYFLPNAEMDALHGVPVVLGSPAYPLAPHLPSFLDGVVLHPTYHPALGLHETERMSLIQQDYRALGALLKGDLAPRREIETDAVCDYFIIHTPGQLLDLLGSSASVALDTEARADGSPWCLSLSTSPRCAGVVMAESHSLLALLAEYLHDADVLAIIHNALYDLDQLARMGITPARFTDTMVLAYLLQDLPQGLKPLAFRLCNLQMTSYEEVLGDVSLALARDYFARALADPTIAALPKPEPRLLPNGKTYKPQGITQRLHSLLTTKDPWHVWDDLTPGIGKEEVLARLGPLPLGDLSYVPLDRAVRYSARDADATLRLYPLLQARIETEGLAGPLQRDLDILPLVDAMQTAGMPVDLDRLAELGRYYDRRMVEIRGDLKLITNQDLNPASPLQVKKLLHGLKIRVKSTDSKTMESLRDRHPAVGLVLDYRQAQKLRTSYVDVLIAKATAAPDRRVHTKIRTTVVATGRLSSSDPNLMAQPVRTKEGRMVRDCYVASPGCRFVSFDYSQVEMRITAHCSQDPLMLDIFKTGKDIHSQTASRMFHLAVEELDEMKHRYPAKRVGFGILNRLSAPGLLRELEASGAKGWTEAACQTMIDDWYTIYSGVKAWLDSLVVEARRFGQVRDLFGRRRLVPEIRSAVPRIVSAGVRQGCNAPIQMGAQSVIKEAMRQILPVCEEFNRQARCVPLLQIHDDLLFEVHASLIPSFVPVIRGIMEHAVELSIPLAVDPKAGESWGSLHKIKKGEPI